jgi:hypothetical protein
MRSTVSQEPKSQFEQAAYDVNSFCRAHRISRALFYILVRDGIAPRLMRVRGRTLVSAKAAAEWRRRMESSSGAAPITKHLGSTPCQTE